MFYRKPQNWKPVLIVFLVFMCGQFSGFAVVTAYTADIFTMVDAGINANTSTIIVGSVRLVLSQLVNLKPTLGCSRVEFYISNDLPVV